MSANQWFMLAIVLTNLSVLMLAKQVFKIDYILKGHIISDFIKEYERKENDR